MWPLYRRRELHMWFRWGKLRKIGERVFLKFVGLEGKIILKWIFKK
jgi:hypothetical protein